MNLRLLTPHSFHIQLGTALFLSIQGIAGENVSVKITPDPEVCTVIHFPRWKEPRVPISFNWGPDMDYDLRSAAGGILAGVFCRYGGSGVPVYSPSKYAVSFGSRQVRKVTETEWEHSDSYLRFRVDANSHDHWPYPDSTKLVYLSKEYPKSGSKWPISLNFSRLSQDGRFLAVNSWDGVAYSADEGSLFGKDHFDGNYYVDIYDVASAQRILLVQGEFHGVQPEDMFSRSAWISKSLYVLPLDWQHKLRKFVICDIQRISN
jgi:hypothetical protein